MRKEENYMSHNNHKNYSKISTTPAIAVVDNESEINNASATTTEFIDGIVSGCKRLNVRVEPSIAGGIVCEVFVAS